MTGVVLLDVVPGADGGLELVAHHHAGALSGGASDEEHDTGPCVGESPLETGRRRSECQWAEPGDCSAPDEEVAMHLNAVSWFYIQTTVDTTETERYHLKAIVNDSVQLLIHSLGFECYKLC